MKCSCQRHTQVFDLPGPAHDLIGANTVRAQQDDLSPPDMLVRGVAVPRQRLQTAAVGRLKSDENSGSHASDSHAFMSRGNPSRIQMSDAIPELPARGKKTNAPVRMRVSCHRAGCPGQYSCPNCSPEVDGPRPKRSKGHPRTALMSVNAQGVGCA